MLTLNQQEQSTKKEGVMHGENFTIFPAAGENLRIPDSGRGSSNCGTGLFGSAGGSSGAESWNRVSKSEAPGRTGEDPQGDNLRRQ